MATREARRISDPLGTRMLGIPAAAALCKVPPSTIIRKIHSGAFPGAFKADDGRWLVPMADLEAAMMGAFGAHRVTVDLVALDATAKEDARPKPQTRRLFGGPSPGWSAMLEELRRTAAGRVSED